MNVHPVHASMVSVKCHWLIFGIALAKQDGKEIHVTKVT